MALGGVDIGRKSAVEAEKPITSDTSTACSGNKEAPTGIKTLAAAVLLIMLDNKVVSQPKCSSDALAFRLAYHLVIQHYEYYCCRQRLNTGMCLFINGSSSAWFTGDW